DELNEGKMLLRDIIDLDATYAGPDAKAVPAPVTGSAGQLIVGIAVPGQPGRPPQIPAPATAPATATPFKPAGERATGEEVEADGTISESNLDDDDMENWRSVAAIEVELKPKVIETIDTIAGAYKRLRRLQDRDIQFQLKRLSLSPAQQRKYKKLKNEIIGEVKSLRLNQARIDALVEQLYDINKRLVGYEGRLMRLAESPTALRATTSSKPTWPPSSTRSGSTGSRNSPPRAGRTSSLTTRTASRSCERTFTRSRLRPASRSARSAISCTWCRRANARRAKRRRRWWRRTCASSSRSRKNTPTAACSSST